MKKISLIFIFIIFSVFLIGCNNLSEKMLNEVDTTKLTLEIVRELSKKGDTLTWNDFEMYECAGDIGSGLYILKYPIDDSEYYLLIGGGSLTDSPLYVVLTKDENAEKNIDIRYENVDSFIESISS